MDLAKAEKLAKREMAKHLNMKEWSFAWNGRKRSFGLCSYVKKEIQLSRFLTYKCDEEQVMDTILHEIAHAIAGGRAGHGWEWKKVAMRIGANPRSTAEGPETTIDERNPAWVMVCPEGKIVKEYLRKPAEKMFNRVKNMWLTGRKADTYGKLKIVPYANYKKYYGK